MSLSVFLFYIHGLPYILKPPVFLSLEISGRWLFTWMAFSSSCLFSAVSGVGGASSNCILRSRAASSDFSCFSSSSFFHTLPAIAWSCGISCSSTSFFFLYWSMMPGIFSRAFRKFVAAACVSAIARCPLL